MLNFNQIITGIYNFKQKNLTHSIFRSYFQSQLSPPNILFWIYHCLYAYTTLPRANINLEGINLYVQNIILIVPMQMHMSGHFFFLSFHGFLFSNSNRSIVSFHRLQITNNLKSFDNTFSTTVRKTDTFGGTMSQSYQITYKNYSLASWQYK